MSNHRAIMVLLLSISFLSLLGESNADIVEKGDRKMCVWYEMINGEMSKMSRRVVAFLVDAFRGE